MNRTKDWGEAKPIGLPTATTWRNIADVTNFLWDNLDIKLFVEIGAAWGGWTALMASRTILFPDFRYLGIELHEEGRLDNNLLRYMDEHPGLEMIYDDCFEPYVVEEIKRWIDTTSGRAIIWCDGTNKPKEVETFVWLLRRNDFLMVHDFSLSPDPDDDPGNASWRDVQHYIDSGVIEDAIPDHWDRTAGMWIARKLV